MAAKKAEASVNWVAEDLKNKELKNIYLLYGEEAFLKQQLRLQINMSLSVHFPQLKRLLNI